MATIVERAELWVEILPGETGGDTGLVTLSVDLHEPVEAAGLAVSFVDPYESLLFREPGDTRGTTGAPIPVSALAIVADDVTVE